MTELLYLPNNDYEKEFSATVTKSESGAGSHNYVVLDQTLFYKKGGGQPSDNGVLTWSDGETHVQRVAKEHGEVRHFVDGALPGEGEPVTGKVDWERRYQLMKMHTAQHLVSWVVLEEYDASTAGNQIHEDQSRIDFAPVSFDDADVNRIERLTNELIADDLPVEKTEMARETVESRVKDGRTNLDLIPSAIDPLRVVVIGDDDICPCGGTHVSSTAEIGGISVVERVNKGSETERLRFELHERER